MRQQSENDPAIQPGMLSSHLWETANILRGPVDAADFKTYIFPLLFMMKYSVSECSNAVETFGEILSDSDVAGHTGYNRLQ